MHSLVSKHLEVVSSPKVAVAVAEEVSWQLLVLKLVPLVLTHVEPVAVAGNFLTGQ